jgi:hypothetical protein
MAALAVTEKLTENPYDRQIKSVTIEGLEKIVPGWTMPCHASSESRNRLALLVKRPEPQASAGNNLGFGGLACIC